MYFITGIPVGQSSFSDTRQYLLFANLVSHDLNFSNLPVWSRIPGDAAEAQSINGCFLCRFLSPCSVKLRRSGRAEGQRPAVFYNIGLHLFDFVLHSPLTYIWAMRHISTNATLPENPVRVVNCVIIMYLS